MHGFDRIGEHHPVAADAHLLQLENLAVRSNIETRPQVLQRADNPFVRICLDRIMNVDPGHKFLQGAVIVFYLFDRHDQQRRAKLLRQPLNIGLG